MISFVSSARGRGRRGMALILVIFILFTLVAIGAPFAVSMTMQDRSSQMFHSDLRAKYAAEAALNAAIAHLYSSHESADTGDADSLLELNPDSVMLFLQADLNQGNLPYSITVSAEVQDEQGKLMMPLLESNYFQLLNVAGMTHLTADATSSSYSFSVADTSGFKPDGGYGYVIMNVPGIGWMYAESFAYSAADSNSITVGTRTVNPDYLGLFPGYAGDLTAPTWISPVYIPLYERPTSGIIPTTPQFQGRLPDPKIASSPISYWDDPLQAKAFPKFSTDDVTVHAWTRCATPSWRGYAEAMPQFIDYLGLAGPAYATAYGWPFGGTHPSPLSININTASRNVLASVFLNVVYTDLDGQNKATTPQDVQLIVDEIDEFRVDGVYSDFQQISDTLDAVDLSPALIAGLKNMLVQNRTFIYRSYDTYTITAAASVNNSAGFEEARYRIREVVQVHPPEERTIALDTQRQLKDTALVGMYYTTSFPNVTWAEDPSDDAAASFVAPRQATYPRNALTIFNYPNPLYAQYYYGGPATTPEGLKVTPDGAKLDGSAFEIAGTSWFVYDANVNNVNIAPGGVSMWVYVEDSISPVYFFDCYNGDDRWNRMYLKYEDGELEFGLGEPAITSGPNGIARVIAPVGAELNRWYHLEVYWAKNLPNYMIMKLDGKIVGDYEPSARLTADVAVADLRIPIDDVDGLPRRGWVVIGVPNDMGFAKEEIVFYTSINTLGADQYELVLNDDPSSPPVGVRGGRGTIPRAHYAGEIVIPLGYSLSLPATTTVGTETVANDIYVGGGTLEVTFTTATTTTVESDLTTTDTAIPVPSGSNDGFPDEGYILLGSGSTGEVVQYTGKTSTSFTGCTRGVLGTVTPWPSGTSVALFGIKVSSNVNYANDCYIQIDNEWFGPVEKGPLPATDYFVAQNDGSSFTALGRGVFGTGLQDHTAGAKVIPVFEINNAARAQGGDSVTVIDINNQREIATIHRRVGGRVAFNDFVTARYNAADYARLLRFPSGELPTMIAPMTALGGQSGSQSFAGYMDDIEAFLFSSDQANTNVWYKTYDFTMDYDNSAAGQDVSFIDNQWFRNGVARIGGEFIVYNTALEVTGRQWLGTDIYAHSAFNQRMFVYPVFQTFVLSSDLSAGDQNIPAQNWIYSYRDDGALMPPPMGTAMELEGEVVLVRCTQTDPLPLNAAAGLKRGAYGSPDMSHAMDTAGYYLPVRYLDLNIDGVDDAYTSHYYVRLWQPRAVWKNVQWSSTVEGAVNWVCMMRMDRTPNHWIGPGASSPRIGTLMDVAGSMACNLQADMMELRFMVDYNNGAYVSGEWKQRPQLESVNVTYRAGNVVFYHEEYGK